MKIFNFGSLNIDRVYRVNHFVQPGETLASESFQEFGGGKGLNQSIALARAGADVLHAGKIGTDGTFLKDLLTQDGVDTSLIHIDKIPTGHAIIQVNKQGENSILLFGGANQCNSEQEVDKILNLIEDNDWLLLQNEVNGLDTILNNAAKLGIKVVLNPAPMTEDVLSLPLEAVNTLIVNEIEGEMFTGKTEPEEIINEILSKHPEISIVLTNGSKGAYFADKNGLHYTPALKVEAVDTTGAGDTFIGYFLSEFIKGSSISNCLEVATKASAFCVTRHGAAISIPHRKELR